VAVFSGAGSYASPSAFGHGFAASIAISAGFSLAAARAATVLPARRGMMARTVPAPVAEAAGS
jgi:hypothetical protein